MQTPAPRTENSPLAQQMDELPLTRLHLVAVVIIMLAMIFDGIELAMSNVLSLVLSSAGTGVGHHAGVGIVIGSTFIGGAIGATVLGRLADRWGRRRACLIILIGFGSTSILAAFTQSLPQLAAARFLSGIFLGAAPPLLNVYLVDMLPAANRARLIMLLHVVSSLAASASPLLTRFFNDTPLFELEGWRVVLALGGIGGLLVAIIAARLLLESPRWLEKVGRGVEAAQIFERLRRSRPLFGKPNAPARRQARAVPVLIDVPDTDKLWSPLIRARVILFGTLELLLPWAMVGFLSLHGVMFAQRGYDAKNALTLLSLTTLGVPLGLLIGSFIADRLRRRVLLTGSALGTAAAAVLFAFAPNAVMAVLAGMLFNMFMIVYFQVLMVFGTEMFPVAVRGGAVGAGYTCNRISAFLAPATLLPMLHLIGERWVLAIFFIAMVISAVLIAAFAPAERLGHADHPEKKLPLNERQSDERANQFG